MSEVSPEVREYTRQLRRQRVLSVLVSTTAVFAACIGVFTAYVGSGFSGIGPDVNAEFREWRAQALEMQQQLERERKLVAQERGQIEQLRELAFAQYGEKVRDDLDMRVLERKLVDAERARDQWEVCVKGVVALVSIDKRGPSRVIPWMKPPSAEVNEAFELAASRANTYVQTSSETLMQKFAGVIDNASRSAEWPTLRPMFFGVQQQATQTLVAAGEIMIGEYRRAWADAGELIDKQLRAMNCLQTLP